MSQPPVIASIVEGHGEMSAVPELVRRIGLDLCGEWIDIMQPFRLHSAKMRQPEEMARAIRFQAARVQGSGGVLIIRDGDDKDIDCPLELVKKLTPSLSSVTVPVEIVIASHEYEAWFLAAAESLRSHRAVRDDASAPGDPEAMRAAKAELQRLMTESYRETLHQPSFSALMDLAAAHERSRSFRRMVSAVRSLIA